MKQKRNSKASRKIRDTLIVAMALILTIASWLFLPYWIRTFVGISTDVEKPGDLGDMYGVINALFTGISIVALVITILIQQKEISESRKMARDERFENRFFKYLDLRNAISRELYTSFENFETHVKANLGTQMTFAECQNVYQKHIEKAEVIKNLGNYLAMFDVMLNSIDKKAESTRKKYYALLTAQLLVNEKRFFLYHFNFSASKPIRWQEIKPFLFAGLKRDHLDIKFRNLEFEGL